MFMLDLTALCRALKPLGRYAKFCNLIEQADSAASAQTDYRRAKEALDTMGEVIFAAQGKLSVSDQRIIGALFNDGLIHYVRAATTESKHRKTMDIRAGWSEDLVGKHKVLVDLRNHAFAHFGPGPDTPDYSAREALVYIENGEWSEFRQALIRANYRQLHINYLQEVVAQAIPDIGAMFDKKVALVASEMKNFSPDNVELKQALIANQFDPGNFFETAAGAQNFVTAIGSGGPGIFLTTHEQSKTA